MKQSTRTKLTKTGGVKMPRSKKDEQEFGPGKKEFVMCSECESVYFDKAWHHSLEQDAKHLREGKEVKFMICPACNMLKNKMFEGELGINLKDTRLKQEILNSIKNSDEKARYRDPLDRVLWTEDKGRLIKVFTSENQLAVKIGKKLKTSFPGGRLIIKHSKAEDVTRVYLDY